MTDTLDSKNIETAELSFAQALIEAAPDRVLWGTDFPHPNVRIMPNDGELVDLLPLICPDETRRRKLLVDNPARLYWAEETILQAA